MATHPYDKPCPLSLRTQPPSARRVHILYRLCLEPAANPIFCTGCVLNPQWVGF